MPEDTGPLTMEQKHELIQKIKDTDIAQIEINNAIAAGVPIGDAQKQLTDVRASLMKLKNVYAPNMSLL